MVVTHRVARTLALTVALSLAVAGSAAATTKNGITPVAPKAGTSVPAGKSPTFTPKFYDYPAFWLNRPGRYFWQAFRIDCNAQDCEQEGPIVRFRVK